MKYEWAEWREASEMVGLKPMRCKSCQNIATRLAIATEDIPFDKEEVVIKAVCEEHFTKNQKKWLKNWRNKNTKD
jgi:C4-type Zn-finger protein